MKSSQITIPTAAALVLLALVFVLFVLVGHAAEYSRAPRVEYEVAVPEYQSDMARMINAYERLSEQYLTLVQQNLAMMDSNDRMILQKMEIIEKKLDELAKQVNSLTAQQSAK